jgi:hypothetical protein
MGRCSTGGRPAVLRRGGWCVDRDAAMWRPKSWSSPRSIRWCTAGRPPGVVDENRPLTRLGAWALPRALAWAWGEGFDSEP